MTAKYAVNQDWTLQDFIVANGDNCETVLVMGNGVALGPALCTGVGGVEIFMQCVESRCAYCQECLALPVKQLIGVK